MDIKEILQRLAQLESRLYLVEEDIEEILERLKELEESSEIGFISLDGEED